MDVQCLFNRTGVGNAIMAVEVEVPVLGYINMVTVPEH